MSTDLETAAEIIGIGRTLAYGLAKKSRSPFDSGSPLGEPAS